MAGKTVLLDLHRCNPQRLADVSRLYSLLTEIPSIIQMRPICAPVIAEVKPPTVDREDWGYSGTILFAESHLYFHTWPEHRKMWVDITSCKPEALDARGIGKLLQTMFGAIEVYYRQLPRDVRAGVKEE
jgi:S-adenosylmethionine/arginine decarboxylase-like enzyme